MASQKESNQTNTFKVNLESSAEDFKKLIKKHVELCNDDKQKIDNFKKIASSLEKAIDLLVFKTPQASQDKILKSIKVYRDEAGFYYPYQYNNWIEKFKQKVIEKKLIDFWNKIIVQNKLGLLWARDCDFFDDIEDPKPNQFYKLTNDDNESKRLKLNDKTVEQPSSSTSEDKLISSPSKSCDIKDIKITSADHYKKLVKEMVENIKPEMESDKLIIFDMLSEQIREILTNSILNATQFDFNHVARDLKIYRDEACFYNPYDYNDWIQEIKVKLKERQMVDFWEEIIVKDQLGLLCARDCDFFDDIEDEEPIKFYDFNCKTGSTDNNVKEVGIQSPAHDYKVLVKREVEELDPDREDERMDIFDDLSKQIQIIIMNILLNEKNPDFEKAAEALKSYRDEAGFYNPYDYNDWIKELKIKLINKKFIDFWENVIVKNQLGLLWARDCDFFDDMEDKEPENFYKIN